MSNKKSADIEHALAELNALGHSLHLTTHNLKENPIEDDDRVRGTIRAELDKMELSINKIRDFLLNK